MDADFARATFVTMGINLLYAIVSLVVGVLAWRLVDRLLLLKVDLEEEIKKGNIAASIFSAALVIFIALVLNSAMGK